MMRFFTMAWWMGDMGDDDADHVLPSYQAHYERIRDRLPGALRDMEGVAALHDSRLLRLAVDIEAATAKLTIVTYDGDHRWTLTYIGLVGMQSTADPEKRLGGPGGYGDLGYDEVDVGEDGLFEHRLLFSTGIELGFRFRDFAFEEETA